MQYCGCWFVKKEYGFKHYLSQVELNAHTIIQSTASRTRLIQTFINDNYDHTPEIEYSFPLYDGVSVVSFKCTVGDKVIFGVVKEKNEAREQYQEAVQRGEVAGLLAQSYLASDVFSTRIGNVPKNAKAVIEIEYVGELKHDAQSDGVRFTIPTYIAPRYGSEIPGLPSQPDSGRSGKIEIAVDIEVDRSSHIEGVSSPSHPIAMTLGRTTTRDDQFRSNCANATLSLGSAALDRDFVLVVNTSENGIPTALLEEHPDIPNHRALMATLVPKFNLPSIHPEIVFVVDRSGSMDGKIPTVVEALKVFLKSIPLSAKFNICSFGSRFSFLFPKSLPYDERSLQHALDHVSKFGSDFGGTEMLDPIKATVGNRLPDVPLEIMVLTDGEIWNQQELFEFVNHSAKNNVRLFSLGIGASASTSLVEGLARAGHGFAQFVQDNEKMDKRVVRMLKGALTPHIVDYWLDVNYNDDQEGRPEDDDFEIIESSSKPEQGTIPLRQKDATAPAPAPISLFDPNFKETATNPSAGRYDHLPPLNPPEELQVPNTITGLFSFSRTSVFMLLPNSTRPIKSITLRGKYNDAPIQLEIPVQQIGKGRTIHQLAAKKAMLETEEGRGWLSTAKAADGTLLMFKHNADWGRIVEREAVRLGVEFQIAGKYCSFVAVQNDTTTSSKQRVLSDVPTEPPPVLEERALYRSRVRTTNPRFSSSASGGGGFGTTTGGGLFGNTTGSALFGRAAPPASAAPQILSFMRPSQQKRAGFGSHALSSAAPPPPQPMFSPSPPGGLFGNAAPAVDSSPELKQYSSMPYGNLDPAPSFSFGNAMSFSAANASPGNVHTTVKSAKSVPQKVPDTTEGKMHRIIELQHFDGSWKAGDELLKLTNVWRADFEDAYFDCEGDDIKATLLAIAWLEKEAADNEEVWEMVVGKAKQWLNGKLSTNNVEVIVRQAMTIFFP